MRVEGGGDPHQGRVCGPTADGKLVSVASGTGLLLDGMVFLPDDTRLVVVHVHGSLGNFYHQRFVRVLANVFARHHIGLLSFNLMAHDGICEGYWRDGDMQYIGGSLSDFASCIDDLDALVSFAQSICPVVVLQGHSLGCDRVLFYLARRRLALPVILLSPCDSYRLQEEWLDGESVSDQVRRLRRCDDRTEDIRLLPSREYGVRGREGWTYNIPVSREALLSVIAGSPFEMLRVTAGAECVSEGPAFVYLGGEDAIRGVTLDAMRRHLRRLMPSAEVFAVDGGDHSLSGCEVGVAERVIAWARNAVFPRRGV